ncbi:MULTISPECIES: DUF805 domain-containing protein [unclassified Caballeronia]|uniref:DUF805 domain-containing protein n=1 Tax=unclassified Caballeronia TaxID=2646786 RepID=UPI00158DC437|nr:MULTISPECIES: DUF805 domain-containing protein [unclassified Caballeronia]QSN61669.1 DUF805 domain-containing protein [Caballeronia sp. M1242]
MDFFDAIRVALFEKYATFNGRASRSEYWFFQLLSLVIAIVATVLSETKNDSPIAVWTMCIIGFALLLPGLAVTVRRLHDTDRSGWFYLIACVPLVGSILLLFWSCERGTPGVNRYGSDPLGNS